MASMKYSEEETKAALKKLRNLAAHKDYWSVNDYQDNFEELQNTIDVLFNSIEGNNYAVDYLDNQNGTRLIIQCKLCSKELTSYDPFITHENGKSHKKILQKTVFIENENIEKDLQLQPLNKPRGIFIEGSLEEKIDSTKLNVLGVQFVFKEIVDGGYVYTCQLCNRCGDVYQLLVSRMFAHLTSVEHNENYLIAKFGYTKTSYEDFEKECFSIEESEGKVHAKIADLTLKDFGKYSKQLDNVYKSESESPSTSDRSLIVPKAEHPEIHSPIPESCLTPRGSDVGVTADMSSEARVILHEINAMQEFDCQAILQDDTDMQDLLQETLLALANKMGKYYNQTGATYNEGTIQTPLSVCAEKVKQYIAEFSGLN